MKVYGKKHEKFHTRHGGHTHLKCCQQHGQISKSKLSELVNLSPTPCWIRPDKLKKAGFVTGYRGEIAINKILDLTKVIVTISLKTHSKVGFDRFEKCIQSYDEIVECCATGGGIDYVIKVVTNSLLDFQVLIEQLLNEELGIDRYIIYVVTREVKSMPPSLSRLWGKKK